MGRKTDVNASYIIYDMSLKTVRDSAGKYPAGK
jgi:hypothetical protein